MTSRKRKSNRRPLNFGMRIESIKIDENHFTSDYIPISYLLYASDNQLKKSTTFMWRSGYHLFALCRAYYIDVHTIELGDVWLTEQYRGKKMNGEKVSFLFLSKVISKIRNIYPKAERIQLVVDSENIPAVKLYERLEFYKVKPSNKFGMTTGVLMSKNL